MRKLCEAIAAGKKLVAMSTWQTLDACFTQHLVYGPGCPAIRISDKNAIVAANILSNALAQQGRNQLRAVVQSCVQALQLQVAPAMCFFSAVISRASAPQAITSRVSA